MSTFTENFAEGVERGRRMDPKHQVILGWCTMAFVATVAFIVGRKTGK